MRKYRRFAATLLLMVLLGIAFAAAAGQFRAAGRETYGKHLMQTAEQAALDLHRALEADQSYLRQTGGLLAEAGVFDQGPLDGLDQGLSMLEGIGMLSKLEALLPGGQAGPEGISFEDAGEGLHVVWRNGLSAQYRVPLERDGKTVAVLCGDVDLNRARDLFPLPEDGGGEWRWLVVDAPSGSLLYQTGHGSPLLTQEAGGPGWDQLLSALSPGIAGRGVFALLEAGREEGFYACYAPAGPEGWMTVLLVPEGEAAARAGIMPPSFFLFMGFLLTAFFAYFFVMLRDMKREKKEGEKQLHNIQYMLEVEKELFDAHIHPERFSTALSKAAEYLSAENAFFWLPGNSRDGVQDHLWMGGPGLALEKDQEVLALFPGIFSILQKKKNILSHQMEALLQEFPEGGKGLARFGIQSLMLCLVTGWNGEPKGILGAYNMRYLWENAVPLEQVSPSFCMAANHYENYQSLARMGRMDGLTGLMNRNCYHTALEELAEGEGRSAACLYIDANGLHELNNHLGHTAGDAMLRAVADSLSRHFDQDGVFRIGGDEFVVLCRDRDRQDILQRAEQVREELEPQGYGLSIGMEWRDRDWDAKSLVNAAEAAMRRDKKRFYQDHGKERQMRLLDQQVERMIVEKQDADTFLSVLAPEFKGVYFVDLTHDTVRHLYIPPYFEELLRESGDRFKEAILLYARRFARTEYFAQFQKFCDDRYLETQMDGDTAPELLYQKLDGSWLKLRVLAFQKSGEGCRETLWIFANAGPAPDGILQNAAGAGQNGLILDQEQ